MCNTLVTGAVWRASISARAHIISISRLGDTRKGIELPYKKLGDARRKIISFGVDHFTFEDLEGGFLKKFLASIFAPKKSTHTNTAEKKFMLLQ